MQIKNETYRQFEISRFIMLHGGPESAPAPTETVETTEPKESETMSENFDLPKEIETKLDRIQNQIKEIEKSYKQKDQKDVAKKFAKKLTEHIREKFQELHDEYKEISDAYGFEGSETEKEFHEKTNDLITRINERLSKANRHIEYEHKQDSFIEGNKAKSELIATYLKEKTGIKNDKLANMLGHFLAETEIVDFDGDLDGNIDVYFDEMDNLQEMIKNNIDDESILDAVIQSFLNKSPSEEADEKEIFIGILENMGEIKLGGKKAEPLKYFSGEEEYTDKILKALATQFDVRPSGEEPEYFIDVTNNTVYTPENINEAVEAAIKLMDNPGKAKNYQKLLEDKTENLRKNRKEIDKGFGGIRGGEIQNWEDWKGHKATKELMTANTKIEEQIQKIETEKIAEESSERINQKQESNENEEKKEWSDLQKRAEFTHERFGENGNAIPRGYTCKAEETDNDQFNVPTKETLTFIKQNSPIVTVTLNRPAVEGNDITINTKGPNYETAEGMNAEDFAKLSKEDLQTKFEQPEKNIKANQENLTAIGKKLEEINKNKLLEKKPMISLENITQTINKAQGETNELAKNYTIKIPFKIGKQPMGEIEIELAQADNATAKIVTEGIDSGSFKLDGLAKGLRDNAKKIQETKKKADENKKKFNAKLNTDKSTLIAISIKEATIEQIQTPEGKFAEDGEFIQIAKVISKEKQTASILLSADGSKYQIQIGGTKHECSDINAVKTKLNENAENLIAKEEIPKDKKLESGKVQKILTETIGKIYPKLKKDSPEFQNAVNNFLKNLKPDRVKLLENEESAKKFILTNSEKKQLSKAFMESYKSESLEKWHESEIKIINELKLSNGKTFKETLGDDFAKTLSMMYMIEKGNGNKITITKNGEEKPKEISINQLTKYLPEEMKAGYRLALTGKLDGEKLEKFKETTSDIIKTKEAVQEINEILKNPNKIDAFKNMGILELIAALGEIIGMINEAIKTKDFTSIRDAVIDFQEGGNPAESAKTAKDNYETRMKGVKDINILTDIHRDPYKSKGAKQFFNANDRYRIAVKSAIKPQMEKILKLGITEIDTKNPNETKITTSKKDRKFEIYLIKEGNETTFMMNEIKDKKSITLEKGKKLDNPQDIEKFIKQALGETDKSVQSAEEESKANKEGIKDQSKLAEDGNTLKDITKTTKIHDVLSTEKVESAIVERKNGKKIKILQGEAEGEGENTFYIEGSEPKKRIRINNGDKITNIHLSDTDKTK